MGAKPRPRFVHLRARPQAPPDWWPTADGEPAWVYISQDTMSWSTIASADFRLDAREVDEIREFFVEDYADDEDTAHWQWSFRVETAR